MNLLKVYWDKTFTHWPYRITLHACFWIFFFSSWLDETMVVKIDTAQHYLVTLTGALFVLYLYYILVYLIVPLFKRRKWFMGIFIFISYYIIAVTLRTYHIELIVQWHNFHKTSIQGGEFLQKLLERQLNPAKFLPIILSSLSSLIVIIYIPLSIKFLRYAYQFSQQQIWMLKENTQLQLNTLKAQLNPHFFFNTLNNLQSFIVQNGKEKSVELLNRLADFMRTSLYDGDQEFVSMEKEISLLNNYISIEKIRFEERTTITSSLSMAFSTYQIPPFIFLPFVENAFKYGGMLRTDNVKITIELIHEENKIILKTTNNFIELRNEHLQQGGIGLQNVRKRLDYYYANDYRLDISTLANVFTVNLEINK